jgi:hypothetical protein
MIDRKNIAHGAALGALSILVPSILWASFSVPHTFAPNTPASASAVNDNFTAIASAMNKTTNVVHTTNSMNTAYDRTCIDNPATNGDPTATLFVSHVFRGADYVQSATYVEYDATKMKWCIGREDKNNLPMNALFNVLVIKP